MSGALTRFRLRILSYLDQRGPTHRYDAVMDLAPPDSKVVRAGKGPQQSARLFGAWVAPLIKDGLVRQVSSRDGFYQHHAITDDGRRKLRECVEEAS